MNEESIFSEALQKPTPEGRAAFLDEACAGDAELRRGVELLLRAHERAGPFLQEPAAGTVATVDEPIRESPGTVVGPYKLLERKRSANHRGPQCVAGVGDCRVASARTNHWQAGIRWSRVDLAAVLPRLPFR